MKLKRCPNLHYYDGDKYTQCPHCADKMKTMPVPEAVVKPAAPAESAVNAAAPSQDDTAGNTLSPEISSGSVSQTKEPDFVPSGEKSWRCEKCGAVNTATFCSVCGEPVPGYEPGMYPAKPANVEWICECGSENDGNFCRACGRRRPEGNTDDAPAAESETIQDKSGTEENAKSDEYEDIYSSSEAEDEALRKESNQEAHEKEHSLTEQIEEVSFTGNIEDAIEKASGAQDEGATRVIFDDIGDGFVLAWLTVTNTSSKGKVYTVTDAKSTIGRSDPESPVDIDIHNDRGISRGAQAFLVYDPLNKKFFLQSAGGKTFIYVNKEMVLTYKELTAYDIIRVGGTDMVFVPLCSEQFSW